MATDEDVAAAAAAETAAHVRAQGGGDDGGDGGADDDDGDDDFDAFDSDSMPMTLAADGEAAAADGTTTCTATTTSFGSAYALESAAGFEDEFADPDSSAALAAAASFSSPSPSEPSELVNAGTPQLRAVTLDETDLEDEFGFGDDADLEEVPHAAAPPAAEEAPHAAEETPHAAEEAPHAAAPPAAGAEAADAQTCSSAVGLAMSSVASEEGKEPFVSLAQDGREGGAAVANDQCSDALPAPMDARAAEGFVPPPHFEGCLSDADAEPTPSELTPSEASSAVQVALSEVSSSYSMGTLGTSNFTDVSSARSQVDFTDSSAVSTSSNGHRMHTLDEEELGEDGANNGALGSPAEHEGEGCR